MTETTLSGRTSPTVRQCCALGNPYAKESSQAGEHPYSWTYLGSGWAPDHLKISPCKLSYAGATLACYLLCQGQAGICCGRRTQILKPPNTSSQLLSSLYNSRRAIGTWENVDLRTRGTQETIGKSLDVTVSNK